MKMKTMKDIIAQQSQALKNRKKELEKVVTEHGDYQDRDSLIDNYFSLMKSLEDIINKM